MMRGPRIHLLFYCNNTRVLHDRFYVSSQSLPFIFFKKIIMEKVSISKYLKKCNRSSVFVHLHAIRLIILIFWFESVIWKGYELSRQRNQFKSIVCFFFKFAGDAAFYTFVYITRDYQPTMPRLTTILYRICIRFLLPRINFF